VKQTKETKRSKTKRTQKKHDAGASTNQNQVATVARTTCPRRAPRRSRPPARPPGRGLGRPAVSQGNRPGRPGAGLPVEASAVRPSSEGAALGGPELPVSCLSAPASVPCQTASLTSFHPLLSSNDVAFSHVSRALDVAVEETTVYTRIYLYMCVCVCVSHTV